MISIVVVARALYSSSPDDLKAIDFFFAFYDIRESLRKIQKLVIDL